jgi:hypothetical protein
VARITEDPAAVHALNEVLERCRVLFMERRSVFVTRERIRWIGAAVRPLHESSPPAEKETHTLVVLCSVGWCWRAAERGETERLRPAIEVAYEAAKADASVAVEIAPAWAAWRFLEDGGQPSLASPGKSERRRREWLDAAFEKMHEMYGDPAGISVGNARSAFERGVVLHDIEQVVLGLGRVI